MADNLSASGILLYSDRELSVGTPVVIEIRFLAHRPTRVTARGSVVRVRHSPLDRHPWLVAARLDALEDKFE